MAVKTHVIPAGHKEVATPEFFPVAVSNGRYIGKSIPNTVKAPEIIVGRKHNLILQINGMCFLFDHCVKPSSILVGTLVPITSVKGPDHFRGTVAFTGMDI